MHIRAGKGGAGQGPCEPSMATLSDGRVLAAFRLGGGIPLWLSYSSDNGKTWTDPQPAKGAQAKDSPGKFVPVSVFAYECTGGKLCRFGFGYLYVSVCLCVCVFLSVSVYVYVYVYHACAV